MSESQGAIASLNGQRVQHMVRNQLLVQNYQFNRVRTIEGLMASKNSLWPVAGQFAEQCEVPLIAPYHRPGRRAVVDFVVLSKTSDVIILSVKSQHSNGSAEQKLEFEIQQLIATERPSAMLVFGPLRGRDGDSGWSPDVLGEIWERLRHYGANRILPFRTFSKLEPWLKDGMPVAGRGRTSAEIFAHYCDLEP